MSANIMFPLYGVAHALISIWLIKMVLERQVWFAGLYVVVGVTLIYDNWMIAFGHLIGFGDLLLSLNYPRFCIHETVTPFLLVATAALGERAGLSWCGHRNVRLLLWAAAIAFSVRGGLHLFDLELQEACFEGTQRYASSTPPAQFCYEGQVSGTSNGPPIPAVLACLMALIIGMQMWIRDRFPWFFLSGLFMFMAAGLGPMLTRGFTLGNGGEVVLQFGTALAIAYYTKPKVATVAEEREASQGSVARG